MFWADNHRWDARTRFSDDPFVSGDVPPHIRDDLKIRTAENQAKIYGSIEALGSNQCEDGSSESAEEKPA